jgi:hypothetical protein
VNFNFKEGVKEDIKDELDLVALTELSNHTFYTFNHAYINTITFTLNTLLY